MIADKQKEKSWGKSVVENLAVELQKEFPGMQGFSVQNLWYMRLFYIEYQNNVILQPLVGEISWTKHIQILTKCKNDNERLFYLVMTKKNNWTKNVLIHQIELKSYEKHLLSQNNFAETLDNNLKTEAALAVKDEYTFDFLELLNQHSEYELEQALLVNIRKFLIEMGNLFTFVSNQYRIEIDNDEFFIDLLLYHRALQCLVAIELKIDDFKPEYAGKMNFYLSALNDKVRLPHENPSIGIIVCRSKKRTLVEFALKDINKPIGVATYTLTENLPDNISKFFPTNQEFINRIEEFEKNLLAIANNKTNRL